MSPFKDPVSHMCLAGAVVASWSLAQEVAGLSLYKDPVSHMCLSGTVVAPWLLTQRVAGLNTHFCKNIFQVLQNSFRKKFIVGRFDQRLE